ncbi:hypothetical protein [Actinophytocola gossypii]|uniref:Uncharacterized protein n=1 Tax=Actinophytocola gossypii TaxID=2812003 RepID=A0ABT2JI51_9PSEU|nr:hypothetical protein [Actinophytocola gossypii]MCT2587194.1 hypothetical protein [Actinophytocola gossypii]
MTGSTPDALAALTAYLRTNREFVAPAVERRVGFPVDADPSVRPYLGSAVWPELRRSAAGMSDADIAEAIELLTPGSPRYVLDDPGYYLVHPTILATGRR